jgi:hypothetical protein
MKLFSKGKDGGPDSTVTGYWLIEIKGLFSIVLLKFENGSRDEFHNHAFNSVNWVLKGEVHEDDLGGGGRIYKSSWKPVKTLRRTFHRVRSIGTTWVFSIRGPWDHHWMEWSPKTKEYTMLTHGRKIV